MVVRKGAGEFAIRDPGREDRATSRYRKRVFDNEQPCCHKERIASPRAGVKRTEKGSAGRNDDAAPLGSAFGMPAGFKNGAFTETTIRTCESAKVSGVNR